MILHLSLRISIIEMSNQLAGPGPERAVAKIDKIKSLKNTKT